MCGDISSLMTNYSMLYHLDNEMDKIHPALREAFWDSLMTAQAAVKELEDTLKTLEWVTDSMEKVLPSKTERATP
jgi:argininosuccinate lyase